MAYNVHGIGLEALKLEPSSTNPRLVIVCAAVVTSPLLAAARGRCHGVRAEDTSRCNVDWRIDWQSWVDEGRVTRRVVDEERLMQITT